MLKRGGGGEGLTDLTVKDGEPFVFHLKAWSVMPLSNATVQERVMDPPLETSSGPVGETFKVTRETGSSKKERERSILHNLKISHDQMNIKEMTITEMNRKKNHMLCMLVE